LPTKGASVGMLHDAVEHQFQRLRCRAVGRHADAREQGAGAGVTQRRRRHHVAAQVLAVRAFGPAAPGRGAARRVGPAGQRIGVVADHVVVVGRLAGAAGELPVGLQQAGAEREQLQQFARIVLVRQQLVVVHVVEVLAHHRRQRDLAQHVAVVAEGVVEQVVEVQPQTVGARQFVAADHHDLLQREGHALAQLVGLARRVAIEVPGQRLGRVPVAPAGGACVLRQVAEAGLAGVLVDRVTQAAGVARHVQRHLAGHPGCRRGAADLANQGLGRPEGGLLRQPRRIRPRHRGHGRQQVAGHVVGGRRHGQGLLAAGVRGGRRCRGAVGPAGGQPQRQRRHRDRQVAGHGARCASLSRLRCVRAEHLDVLLCADCGASAMSSRVPSRL
jgi:hypothetical protein